MSLGLSSGGVSWDVALRFAREGADAGTVAQRLPAPRVVVRDLRSRILRGEGHVGRVAVDEDSGVRRASGRPARATPQSTPRGRRADSPGGRRCASATPCVRSTSARNASRLRDQSRMGCAFAMAIAATNATGIATRRRSACRQAPVTDLAAASLDPAPPEEERPGRTRRSRSLRAPGTRSRGRGLRRRR